jgi:hypothetical protein
MTTLSNRRIQQLQRRAQARKPSHCRHCRLPFCLVDYSEVVHLCVNCLPLFADSVNGTPEFYYCESCGAFCLIRDNYSSPSTALDNFSWYSYPYCYGCDYYWNDDDEQ